MFTVHNYDSLREALVKKFPLALKAVKADDPKGP